MNAKVTTEGKRSDLFASELASSLRDDSLHLILLPTEKCNFRCTYCYEDFSIGRMDSAVVEGIKRLIDRRIDGLRSLTISWFGGEPLLALPVIEEISTHVSESAATKPDLEYSADMTTNAYLLDHSTADRLSRLGIREYQVSLDGPQSMHDQTRLQANGAGSFHRIWDNLLTIRDSDLSVSILIRVHITPANLSSMPDFLRDIRNTFLGDSRFSVLLKPVERLGGPGDGSMDVISHDSAPAILANLASIVSVERGGDSVHPMPEVCYASRPNSLMIRANGVVGKCTVTLTDPRNAVGSIRPDGTLEINNPLLRPWLRGWGSGDWSALSCPANGLPGNRTTLLDIGPTRLASDM
ncbi:radical SAM protein [Streptomyces sp. NBC_01167]|uniref:radical SAM protein n=1 Tax=Streptomyces sp. NBC_01167 TaxID=2903756 RepID=UPI003863CDA8|nr:radical SAM protein [Streptomyces sp. NBC_01167]